MAVIEDKTADIGGKTGKVWYKENKCWCPAEILSRSERAPDMWKVKCMPGNKRPVLMENVRRSSIRLDGEVLPDPENICMSGGSYKKYKTKKRKIKKKKTKKRKSKKRRKTKRRRR